MTKPKTSRDTIAFQHLGSVIAIVGRNEDGTHYDHDYLNELLGADSISRNPDGIYMHQEWKGRALAGDSADRAREILAAIKSTLAEIKRSES